MTRTITGVQLHHSSRYPRIAAHLSNAQQYLAGIEEMTTVEEEAGEAKEIREALLAFNKRIWAIEQRSKARMRAFHLVHPQEFRDAADGRRPWHDENDDVELRCTCNDLCLHRFGTDPGPSGICNCEGVKRPCPAHKEAA